MFEEDYPLPGYQSSTESYVTAQFLGLGLLSTWFFAGDFAGGPPICAAIGALSIFFYFFYRREGAITTSSGRRFFKRWLLIPIAFIAMWSIGQFNPVVAQTDIGERTFLHLIDLETAGPVTSLTGAHWATLLYVTMVMLSSVGLVAFTQSQFALGQIVKWLFINAVVLTAIGILGAVLHWRKILTFMTPAQEEHFFSLFPQSHQWAAFALFWTIVGFGVILHLQHRSTWKSLFSQNGAWMILGWLALAGSVYWTGAPVHRFLLGVGIGLLLLCLGVMLAGKGRTGTVSALLGGLFGLGGLGLAGYSIWDFANLFTAAQADATLAPFGIPWEIQTALWRDAWALVMERPAFGWGVGSFAEVFHFRQQIDLGQGFYASPHSDLLRGLVEYGFVGMALWVLFPLGLMLRFATLKVRRKLSHYLWGGVTLLSLLALVSQPLSSPANFVLLWMGLGLAYKWSQAAEMQIKSAQQVRRSRRKKSSGGSRSDGRASSSPA